MCPNADNWLLLEQMRITCTHVLANMDEEKEAGPTIFDFWIGFRQLLIAGARAIRKYDLQKSKMVGPASFSSSMSASMCVHVIRSTCMHVIRICSKSNQLFELLEEGCW
jgi:hypothetical protein